MKKTILLVDDFANTLYVTEMTLKRAGYNIIKALSGKEALSEMAGKKVDLIISDFNMPGMNGLEFIQKVKEDPLRENVPVFILSTEIKKSVKEAAYAMGVTAWVAKPFNIAQLLKQVEKVLK